MALLYYWLVLSLAVFVATLVLPGFKVQGAWGALVVGALFGVLNWAFGWLLYVMIGLGTLGLGFLLGFLTRWLVNAILLKVVDLLTDKLQIRSFGWALGAALIMSAVSTLLQRLS